MRAGECRFSDAASLMEVAIKNATGKSTIGRAGDTGSGS